MSKRINDDFHEIDLKKLKANDDNKSDLDSPLQFFDDHVSFNYVHVSNEVNLDTISEISNFPSDKLNIPNGLDHPIDQPDLVEPIVKNESQNKSTIIETPSDVNVMPMSCITNVLVEKTGPPYKHEYSESIANVENLFVTDLPQGCQETELPIHDSVRIMSHLQSTDIDISTDKSDTYPVKSEHVVQDVIKESSTIEENVELISNNENNKIELEYKLVSDDKISDEATAASVQNDMDIDDIVTDTTVSPDIPTETMEIANDDETTNGTPVQDTDKATHSQSADVDKPRRRSTRLLTQNNESTVNNGYNLRKSITKSDVSKEDERKVKPISAQAAAILTVPRRMSSRIEKIEATKLNDLMRDTTKTPRRAPKRPSAQFLDSDDPANWPPIVPNSLKVKLIEKGPYQIENMYFPRDNRQRCFSSSAYTCRGTDGKRSVRNWLVYSVAKDAAFCFPCRIFATDSNSSLVTEGFRNWKKLADRLNFHSRSAKHVENMEQWAAVSIENELSNSVNTISADEALRLVDSLKQFAASKENKMYLLTKQLECELKKLKK